MGSGSGGDVGWSRFGRLLASRCEYARRDTNRRGANAKALICHMVVAIMMAIIKRGMTTPAAAFIYKQ